MFTAQLARLPQRRLLALNVGFRDFSLFLCADPIPQQAARRLQSSSGAAEPPPAGGHLPNIATSSLLRTTRDSALRTPGLRWVDEDNVSSQGNLVSGRETRKMNLYQAVRDAMRCATIPGLWRDE